MKYRIGIDTGGTFTDLICLDVDTGAVHSLKVPSTPREPLRAFIDAIRGAEVAVGEVGGLVHGTTVATNALIERMGAKVAFVTTAGFEDIPFIQRVNRRELYNLDWDKPRPLLRSRRDGFGIRERVDAKGQSVVSPDGAEMDALCDRLLAGGYEAVAVCLLFSYLNTVHERMLKARLEEGLPGIPLSVSHEVAPIWREYERSSTTIADAYLKPLIGRYVRSLQEGLHREGIRIPWTLMKSNGGVVQAGAAADQPIHLATSGPAGGLVACQYIAGLLGLQDVVTIDVGGTSADVGVVLGGELRHTTEFEIEWGIPAAIPLIDLKTIGAGGGSIAWVNAGGFLQVGPRSAGAAPGPVCYGQGGTEPTLTDANLVLGRLDPEYFLGGKMPLHPDLARAQIAAMAVRVGMAPLELAHAIVDIANENMANAIRMVSIERGYDPRKFALVAFGGAGPLHGGAIARKLDMPTVVIPPFPGAFSAMGLLMADLRVDKVWTQGFRSDLVLPEEVEARFRTIGDAAVSELKAQGFLGPPEVRHFIHVRYLGQNYETEVEVPTGRISLGEIFEAFHRTHEAAYGYRIPTAVIELVSFKVTAVGTIPKPRLGRVRTLAAGPSRERLVYFRGHGFIPCGIVRRAALPVDERLHGPMIVEEEGATTVVEPGMSVVRTEHDVLMMDISQARRPGLDAPADR